MPRTETETPTAPRPDRSGEIIGRYRAKLKEHSATNKSLKDENEALKAKLTDAQKAVDEHPLRRENQELKGQIRTGRHKAVFDRVAKESGANEKALDVLFRESGYKADKDDVDEAAVREAVARVKETHDYAFGSGGQGQGTPTPTPTTVPTPTPPPVPGGGRGGSHAPNKSGIVLTKEQLRDPKFMLDKRNKEMIRNARIQLPDRQAQ